MLKRKQYKCSYCERSVFAEESVCEEKVGTRTKKNKDGSTEKVPHTTRRYFHKDCKEKKDNYSRYKKATEDFLTRLYGGVIIPASLVIAHNNIAKLPNGSYEIIYKTYQLVEPTIQYWIENKNDFKNTDHKMLYGFKIMENKLNDVYEQEELKKSQAIAKEKSVEQVLKSGMLFEEEFLNHTKQKDCMDISDLLD